uniref:uncharacterized protein LOC122599494 n=1 Tax=Erigeron canadensis TaxID=72917 RepID=UPI001CB9708B|nr:uncharacterized protein LOC122599494 [Erigeron canadensis]
MAANLLPVPPPSLTVRSSAGGNQKPDSQRKNWWTPLFGWSSEPDYIDTAKSGFVSEPDLDRKTIINRSPAPAKFTDEKARKLRMLTVETETFHDAMYHSAIASRLASDFSDRSDL